MKQNAKVITASSLMGLLFSSFVVIIGGMNNAEAQESSSSEVNAASGSNRFVVWQDTTGTGPGDIYLKRSTDNGATWKAAVNLSNNAGLSQNPRIAVSGANVFVVWSQSNVENTATDIILKRSTDNGVTWKTNQKITPGGTCTTSSFLCHIIQTLEASGTNVYLVTGIAGDIHFRRSSDNGVTWKTPVNLSSNAGSSFDPDIAISGTNVYLTWTQANAANTSFDILFRRSTDSGATWKSKVNLSNDPEGSNEATIAVSGSSVYVAWDGTVFNDEDREFQGIKLKRSMDGGATFGSMQEMSEPMQVDGEWTDGAALPELMATGSNVFLAWHDNLFADGDKEGDSDIFFRRSLDGGDSWDPSIKIGHASNNSGPTHCNPFTLAAAGSNVYIAWSSSASCGHSYSISFSYSTNNGASWSAPDSMGDVFLNGAKIGSPIEMAVSDSTVFLVITRVMSGPGSDIFVARSTNSGQTWPVAINVSKLSGVSENPQLGL
jgi:hypothetical protein